jgi:hypothetical protein
VEVEPSPKFHAVAMMLPVEADVKATVRGTLPLPGV